MTDPDTTGRGCSWFSNRPLCQALGMMRGKFEHRSWCSLITIFNMNLGLLVPSQFSSVTSSWKELYGTSDMGFYRLDTLPITLSTASSFLFPPLNSRGKRHCCHFANFPMPFLAVLMNVSNIVTAHKNNYNVSSSICSQLTVVLTSLNTVQWWFISRRLRDVINRAEWHTVYSVLRWCSPWLCFV